MLKKYLKENKISIRSLSMQTGIPYSTLNDIVNGKTELDRVAFGYVRKLKEALGLTFEDFTRLCERRELSDSDSYSVIIRNKAYYLHDESGDKYIFKVNPLNTEYLDFAVKCIVREEKERREMEEKWKSSTTSCGKTKL